MYSLYMNTILILIARAYSNIIFDDKIRDMELRIPKGGDIPQFLEIKDTPTIDKNGAIRQLFLSVNYFNTDDILSVIENGIRCTKTKSKVWMTAFLSSRTAISKKFPFVNGEPNPDYEINEEDNVFSNSEKVASGALICSTTEYPIREEEKKYTPQEEERGKDYLWKYLNEGDRSLLIFHMKKEETGADTMKLKELSIEYQYH
jgi:hypothetical protein